MLGLVRFALQIVVFFVLLSLAVGIASEQTGLVEKVVLAVFAGLLIWLASVVRRIGKPRAAQSG